MGLSFSNFKVALKAYGVFAVLHVIYKLANLAYRLRRYRKMLSHLPGGTGVLGQDFVANVGRIHDWRLEQSNKFPEAPMITDTGPGLNVVIKDKAFVKTLLKVTQLTLYSTLRFQ